MPRARKGYDTRHLIDRLDIPELETIGARARRKVMYNAAKIVALRARQIVPDSGRRHKGKLKRTIRYRAFAGGVRSQVAAKSPLAHLVHNGTAAHGISAKTKGTARSGWRFYRNSTRTVAKHPGAHAQPFLIEARDQTQHEVEQQMRKDMQEILDDVARGARG